MSKRFPEKKSTKKKQESITKILPKLDISLDDLNAVLEELRPYIAMDGGDIQIVDVKDLVVYVKLYGACVGCGSAPITLQYGVENLLREKVHPDIEVVPVYDDFD